MSKVIIMSTDNQDIKILYLMENNSHGKQQCDLWMKVIWNFKDRKFSEFNPVQVAYEEFVRFEHALAESELWLRHEIILSWGVGVAPWGRVLVVLAWVSEFGFLAHVENARLVSALL